MESSGRTRRPTHSTSWLVQRNFSRAQKKRKKTMFTIHTDISVPINFPVSHRQEGLPYDPISTNVPFPFYSSTRLILLHHHHHELLLILRLCILLSPHTHPFPLSIALSLSPNIHFLIYLSTINVRTISLNDHIYRSYTRYFSTQHSSLFAFYKHCRLNSEKWDQIKRPRVFY